MTCTVDTASRAPQTIGSRMALLLAFASGAAVANVYYAQPLLDDLGAQLHMSPAALGWVTTATQGGYLIGLVMVVPLGDRFDRRRIILIQLALTAIGLLGAAAAPSAWTFLVFSAFFGAASTVVEVITAFAAAASPPGRRGRPVGVVTSGVVLGILLARSISGFIADLWGWRAVFTVAAVVMLGVAVWLAFVLPRDTIAKEVIPYRLAVTSVVTLTMRDRTFRVRSLIGGLMFASFGAAWGSMALPLATTPWHLTTAQIGLFGIVGAAGALGASGAGRPGPRRGRHRRHADRLPRSVGGDRPNPKFLATSRDRPGRPRLRRRGDSRHQPTSHRGVRSRGDHPPHRRLHGLLLDRHGRRGHRGHRRLRPRRLDRGKRRRSRVRRRRPGRLGR
jgi:predicted MFS family arabinose efflux permease